MTEIKTIKIYADSIVYDLGERTIHDFHGDGIIDAGDDKVCLKSDVDHGMPCGVLNFPKATPNDNALVQEFQRSHADYINKVVSQARSRFGTNVTWQKHGDQNVAEIKAEEGTFKFMDRNGDRRVDIFEFIPTTVNPSPHSAFDIGVKILRDYSDEAFDHKEDRPIKNPLSVPYLDRF